MTGDLGALGFWLMLGMIIAASIVKGGLRERDKDREREATLRALLDKNEKTVTEVLAYLREKDDADRKLLRQMSGIDWWNGLNWRRIRAVVAAIVVAAAALFVGLLSNFVIFKRAESRLVPLGMMLACWVAGGVIAWLIVRSSRNKKNDGHPDA